MRIFLKIAICILVFAGCSQGARIPTSPSNNLDGAPLMGISDTGDNFNDIGILGAYELTINPDLKDVGLVPKRFNTAIGDSYLVSGTKYFTSFPCTDCLIIKSYAFDSDGSLIITFTAKHPFAKGNPIKPASGVNRNDLDVFDLAALVVPQIGATTPTTFPKIGASIYNGICRYPSGYTTELKNVTHDPAAIPFFLVIDDSSGTSTTYNRFAQGASANFNITLSRVTGPIPLFDIYLTMGYGSSARKTQRLTPKYYNPEFNRKNAWKVQIYAPSGGWKSDDNTTTKNVVVKVWDWQQGAVVSTTTPYSNETDTTKIAKESNVARVSVEIPGMNNTLPYVTTATSGTGAPLSPLYFTIPVANQNLLAAGYYVSLVKVLDQRVPGSGTEGSIDSLIHNPGLPYPLTWNAIPEFATYYTFTAYVSNP